MGLSQLYHTVRHLRARQVFGQLSRRVLPARHHPARTATTQPEPFPGLSRQLPPELLPPYSGRQTTTELVEGHFEFLNHSRELGFPPRWATAENETKLWCYNLHYFDWMHQLDTSHVVTAVRHWVNEFPPDQGGTPWEPYPTSLRCLNWILYVWGTHRTKLEHDESFIELAWDSLARQLNYLSQNLETHLLGNHLLENLTTLTIAGSCFSGETAKRWKRIGHRGLTAELAEQFPPDGLHFEASPMYHLRTLHLLYLLESTGDPELQSMVRPFLLNGVEALKKVCHPDGEIALFNDSAKGIYHPAPVLVAAIQQRVKPEEPGDHPEPVTGISKGFTGHGQWSLPDSGYYGFRDNGGNYLICDAGSIGPDYLPGHAHGDMLSYELSYRGHRVIVDTGNYDYELGTPREISRSTKAHNTVELNSQDQCDFWGAFRVGRRGAAKLLRSESTESTLSLTTAHSGYERAPIHATHQRTFHVGEALALKVDDHVQARNPVIAISSIHLAPECEIIEQGPLSIVVRYPKGIFEIVFSSQGELTVDTSDYFPEFGVRIRRTCLRYEIRGTDLVFAYQIRQRPAASPLSTKPTPHKS